MKIDRTDIDYAPLNGTHTATPKQLYDLHAELRKHQIPSVTWAGQAHAETHFASAWNKASRRYRAGIPIRGTRMRQLVTSSLKLLSPP